METSKRHGDGPSLERLMVIQLFFFCVFGLFTPKELGGPFDFCIQFDPRILSTDVFC